MHNVDGIGGPVENSPSWIDFGAFTNYKTDHDRGTQPGYHPNDKHPIRNCKYTLSSVEWIDIPTLAGLLW